MPTLNPTQFSNNIINYWHSQYQNCECIFQSHDLSVFITPQLDQNYHAMQLALNNQKIILVSPNFAQHYHLNAPFNWVNLNWQSTDQIFYYDKKQQDIIKNLPKLYLIRTLTLNDQQIFNEFLQQIPMEDLQNTSVSLDHWLIYGVFVHGQLVAAASMQPWDKDEHKIADIGVITLPKFRRQGHAKRLIRSISQAAILLDYEPQYRCQLNNLSSVTLAQSAGLSPLLQWDVVLAD